MNVYYLLDDLTAHASFTVLICFTVLVLVLVYLNVNSFPSCLVVKFLVIQVRFLCANLGNSHVNRIYCPQIQEPSGFCGWSALPFIAWLWAYLLHLYVCNCKRTISKRCIYTVMLLCTFSQRDRR